MVNFPFSIDDDTTLFLTANNLRTKLTSAIDNSTLTIPVITTSGFPNTGFITILTGDDITLAEAISYEGYLNTSFSGTLRGAGGTTAAIHNSTDNVDFTIVADHHNSLKDAVIALENFVGVSGSESFLTVTVSGDITVTGTANFCGDSFFSEDSKWKPKDPATASVIFENNDSVVQLVEGDSTNTRVGIVSDTLVDGVEYLIIYFTMYGKSQSDGTGTVGKLWYSNAAVTADTEYLDGDFPVGSHDNWSDFADSLYIATCSGQGGGVPDFSGAGNHGPMQGFTTVTGTGDSKLYITTHEIGGATGPERGPAPMKNQTVIAFPLSDLTEGVDYFKFVDNNPSDTDFVMTGPPEGFGAAGNVIIQETINIKNFNNGNYMVYASVEMDLDTGVATADGGEVKFSIDGSAVSEVNRRHCSSTLRQSHTFVAQDVVNLSVGTHTLLIEGASIVGSASKQNYRRPRFFLFKADSFDQTTLDTTLTVINHDPSIGDSSYFIFGDLTNTYTPNQPEDYLVLSHHYGNSEDILQGPKVQMSGSLDGIQRADSYWAAFNSSEGDDEADDDVHGLLLPHKVTSTGTEAQTWDFHYAKLTAPVAPQHDAVIGSVPIADPAQSSMFLWSLTLAPEEIECTTVTTTGITAPEIFANQVTIVQGLTVSGTPVNIAPSTAATLQTAYDSGDGFISVTGGKPVIISGTTSAEDFRVVGSGTFTEALTVGQGTTHLNNISITTGSGIFTDTLTVGGVAVATGNVVDSLNSLVGDVDVVGKGIINVTVEGQNVAVSGTAGAIADPLVLASGTFSDSLTVSGVPVDTTGGGGGAALTVREVDNDPTVNNVDTIVVTDGTLTDDGGGQVTISTGGGGSGIDDINGISSGSVTVTGAGTVDTITTGNTITISGSPLAAHVPYMGALLSLGSDQLISSASSEVVEFVDGDAVYDTHGFHGGAVNPTRLTVPSGLNINKVLIKGQAIFLAVQSLDRLSLFIKKNDTFVFDGRPGVSQDVGFDASTADNAFQAAPRVNMVSPAIEVVEGDYFEFFVSVGTTTGDITVDADGLETWFGIEAVDVDTNFVIEEFTATSGTFTQTLNVATLPTASAGLAAGDVWIDESTYNLRVTPA